MAMNRVTANQYRLILNISDQSATTEKGVEEPDSAGKGKDVNCLLAQILPYVQINRCFDVDILGFISELWPFKIPEVPGQGPDCWDLFVQTNGSERSVSAVSQSEASQTGKFIGTLDLQQLGFWDRRKRRDGKLGQAYILKAR